MPTARDFRPPARGARRFWHDAGAAALVEFALVMPILLVVIFGAVDFGRALWTANVATSALREGARTAAAQVSATSCASAYASAVGASGSPGRVKTYMVKAGFDTTTFSVAANCDANNYITVCFGTASACNTAASTHFPFTPLAPLASKLVLTNGVKIAPAVFRWEKSGS